MTARTRTLLALSLIAAVALLALAAVALASPDGDDDTSYAGGGTAYSSLTADPDGPFSGGALGEGHPAIDQAPDGSSITAVLMSSEGPYLRLTRFDATGKAAGFDSGTGIEEVGLDDDLSYSEVLDLRVLADGSFVVLLRARAAQEGDRLVRIKFDADGLANPYVPQGGPEQCVPTGRGMPTTTSYLAAVDAARVTADGRTVALWDCYTTTTAVTTDRGSAPGVVVTSYAATGGGDELDEQGISVQAGFDIELGPDGSPFVLVGQLPTEERGGSNGSSSVLRYTLDADGDLNGDRSSIAGDGYPIDLAVDSQGRPLVWTGGSSPVHISRLLADLSGPDLTWGDAGTVSVDREDLGPPEGGGRLRGFRKFTYLTIRPGDRVLASTRWDPNDDMTSGTASIITGLTSAGALDTGFGTGGFRIIDNGKRSQMSVGEPTLQSDSKVLVAHTTEATRTPPARITATPDGQAYLGVTRLNPAATTSSGSGSPMRPIISSSVPALCGRRAISLVRADVKGNRVELTGLVGAALYGKKVSIQTDPTAASASRYSKTTTITASKSGAFSAYVRRPAKRYFVSIRYRAVSGTAKSPALKLPQSLTSRSVKSAKGTITVKGRVKQSVLGRRNSVKIRRLVCGRYRTVGSARPDRNGNYAVTFKATSIRGVSFYRAESVVQVRPGSKKYAIQYARAIAIRTTSQTG